MSRRTFSVHKCGDQHRIAVSEHQSKRSKVVKSYLQGYLSSNAAYNDIGPATAHLDSGQSIRTFKKNIGTLSTRRIQMKHDPPIKSLNGCVAKAVEKAAKKKYNLYCKRMLKVNLDPISRSEWDAIYSTGNSDRDKRAFSRDPHIRYLYLLNGMESNMRRDNIRAIEDTIKYMRERKVTLSAFIIEEEKLSDKLQGAIYSSRCFTLLLKAKFEEDVIDLTEHKFTFQNTSKEQLSRVSIQSYITLSLSLKLIERSRQEIDLLQEGLDLISCSEESFEVLKAAVDDVLLRRNNFKVQNSMGSLVEKVYCDSKKTVSQKRIRNWYNEFKELGLFKEDLRGCYQRISFLKEYNYMRLFQLYLRNEKFLSVDEAKRNLEFILDANPPESVKGKKVLSNLLPLSRSTVHRWMIQAGCKYEKASVSYYTDSHELESTKQDFLTR